MGGKVQAALFLQGPVTGKYLQMVHYRFVTLAPSVVPTEVQNAWGRLRSFTDPFVMGIN